MASRGPKAGKEIRLTRRRCLAGRYVLRLEGQWEKWQQPAVVSVKIEQNVTHGFNLILALIASVDWSNHDGYLSHQFRTPAMVGEYV